MYKRWDDVNSYVINYIYIGNIKKIYENNEKLLKTHLDFMISLKFAEFTPNQF